MCTGQTKHTVQHNWGAPASLPDCALPGRHKSVSYSLLSEKYNFGQILEQSLSKHVLKLKKINTPLNYITLQTWTSNPPHK